jgi:heme/copper-type cytochrome/quinol oxidase subunit 2
MKDVMQTWYAKLGAIVSVLILLPISSFAAHQDPFGVSLGLDLKDGGDAGETIGKWLVDKIWYIGVVVVICLLITGVYNIVSAMHQNRTDKEHAGSAMKIVFAIVCIVIGIAISGLLFMGMSNASGT